MIGVISFSLYIKKLHLLFNNKYPEYKVIRYVFTQIWPWLLLLLSFSLHHRSLRIEIENAESKTKYSIHINKGIICYLDSRINIQIKKFFQSILKKERFIFELFLHLWFIIKIDLQLLILLIMSCTFCRKCILFNKRKKYTYIVAKDKLIQEEPFMRTIIASSWLHFSTGLYIIIK